MFECTRFPVKSVQSMDNADRIVKLYQESINFEYLVTGLHCRIKEQRKQAAITAIEQIYEITPQC